MTVRIRRTAVLAGLATLAGAVAGCGTVVRDLQACSQLARRIDVAERAVQLQRDALDTDDDGTVDGGLATLEVIGDADRVRLITYRRCMVDRGWTCMLGVWSFEKNEVSPEDRIFAAAVGWEAPRPWQCRSSAGRVVEPPDLD